MKALPLTSLVVALAAALSAPAMAQDGSSSSGLEPYVGVMGGVHNFDSETGKEGIPPVGYKGRMVEGVAGVNYNVAGPLVVGVEGSASKGVSGDIDWEYGAAGRVGVKAGKDTRLAPIARISMAPPMARASSCRRLTWAVRPPAATSVSGCRQTRWAISGRSVRWRVSSRNSKGSGGL